MEKEKKNGLYRRHEERLPLRRHNKTPSNQSMYKRCKRVLTEHFKEELALGAPGLVARAACVRPTVALPDVFDGQRAFAPIQRVKHIMLRSLDHVTLPVDTDQQMR